MNNLHVNIILILSLTLTNLQLKADQFHYQNILVGDRAIGMGGAFTGVSDDASGVFYNPAGLAFGLANDVSGSANAFYSRTVRFKNTLGGQDFVEKSGGSVPSFFGGVQKLGHIYPGLVFGFAVYSTDSDLKDQDDLIPSAGKDPVELGTPTACTNAQRDSTKLLRFHRTVNHRGSTTHAGGGLSLRVTNNISVGVGANFITIDELVQEYQDVKSSMDLCLADGSKRSDVEQKAQNIRQHLTGSVLQPILGLQATFWERLSLGLTMKFGAYVSQQFQQSYEYRVVSLETTDQDEVNKGSTHSTNNSALITQLTNITDTADSSEKPLGSFPAEIRLGSAFFVSTQLLITADLSYHGAVTDSANMAGLGQIYNKESVINFAGGVEYYVTPAIPVRAGFFTNRDARPQLKENQTGQKDHIDYNGGTVFVTWAQPNSHIGVGLVYQDGKGEAQKIGGSSAIQEVEANSVSIAISATHSF